MRRTIVLGLLFLVSLVGTSAADRRSPIRVDWDSRGWQMLGEQTVNGRVDRDVIRVGRYEGRFNKLTLVVHDSDLELLDFVVHFADRTKYEPRLRHHFREGGRTHVINLPPGEQLITHIDLKYKNSGYRDGVAARVQVWGFKIGDSVRPPPRPIRVDWDNKGWELLGEHTVSGRVDRDRIVLGRSAGKFTKLTLVTLDSDLDLLDFSVTFANNETWRPGLRHRFGEGTRTHAIDFPGDRRTIKHIDFTYKNVPGDYQKARFQVWGKHFDAPVVRRDAWDNRGWTLLGEQRVNGRVDRDRITVGRDEGKFRKLMIVVLDSDLELLEFFVNFTRGADWRPNVRQRFFEGTRTRSIDLPGDRRSIRYIDLKYANLPGGGAATIQVWGR